MRKWIPTIWGLIIGSIYGLYLLLFVAPENIPGFISVSVGKLGTLFLKATSEAAGLVFVAYGMVLFCAVLGAIVGFVGGLVLKAPRKARTPDSP